MSERSITAATTINTFRNTIATATTTSISITITNITTHNTKIHSLRGLEPKMQPK